MGYLVEIAASSKTGSYVDNAYVEVYSFLNATLSSDYSLPLLETCLRFRIFHLSSIFIIVPSTSYSF
jgi:hypothetical protein